MLAPFLAAEIQPHVHVLMAVIKFVEPLEVRKLLFTSRVPDEGKSPVCVVCMKYRIII